MNNYDKMSADASRLFLEFDQEELIRRMSLRADDREICVTFLSKEYRIDRSTGRIRTGDRQADFQETLSIFDYICRSEHQPRLSGEWVTLQQLTNAAGAGPVSMDMFGSRISRFSGHPKALAAACENLGGLPKKGSEVSFLLPVFPGFPVWFQFWDADDEFPVSVQFLWDKTTPQHLHYETLWYIMGEIISRLQRTGG